MGEKIIAILSPERGQKSDLQVLQNAGLYNEGVLSWGGCYEEGRG